MTSLLFLFLSVFLSEAAHYKTKNGQIRFESNASLEHIQAKSDQLRGVIDAGTNAFSFAIKLNSFRGFNSNLQMEHYNENYVESDLYHEARFKGKIVEDINWLSKKTYEVRAKGEFELHGIQKIEIVHGTLQVIDDHTVLIKAGFIINLSDYNIKIPRIVHKKLSETIDVEVEALMKKSDNH